MRQGDGWHDVQLTGPDGSGDQMFVELPVDGLNVTTGRTGSSFAQTAIAHIGGSFLGRHVHQSLSLGSVQGDNKRSATDAETVHDLVDDASKQSRNDGDLEIDVAHVTSACVGSASTGAAECAWVDRATSRIEEGANGWLIPFGLAAGRTSSFGRNPIDGPIHDLVRGKESKGQGVDVRTGDGHGARLERKRTTGNNECGPRNKCLFLSTDIYFFLLIFIS